MNDIAIGNQELLAIVDTLDNYLHADINRTLKTEDRAMVSGLRKDIGSLIGKHSRYIL